MSTPHPRTPPPVPRSATDGIVFPGVAGGNQAMYLAQLQQLELSQYLPPDELAARQWRQVEQVLWHASRTVPFYRDRLRRAGIRAGRPVSPEQWRAIAPLTREEIQTAGDRLHSTKVPAAHGGSATASTSGSTGKPITVRKTALEQFFWNVFTLREELWHGRDLGGRFAAIRHDPTHRSGAPTKPTRMQDWGPPVGAVYPTGPGAVFDIRATVAEQVEWLRREQPNVLLTFASNMLALARHCRAHDIALPSLRALRTSGDMLHESTRETCREVFGLELADMYSAVETGYIAVQCPDHEHYHVQAENLLLEVVDDAGAPCAPGRPGRVLLTPLLNFAMPLIRYEVGDIAELGPSCPCGRTLPVLTRILGRARDMLLLPSGDRRFPHHNNRKMVNFPAIVQYQLAQVGRERIDFRLVTRRPLTAEEEADLRATVLAGLGHPFDLHLVYLDEIPRTAAGKFEEFRCEYEP
ncbi:MAG: phenylacetate--CoA ligase family protein [Alphaproteobacteria bacterium]